MSYAPSIRGIKEEGEEFQIVGFEILTALIMKITIFWVMTLLKVKRRFGGTY
jgi:hypothetical protein